MKKNPIISYLRESKEELEKVSWPTRRDTIRYTTATIVMTAILAVLLGALDLGFTTGLRELIDLSGGSSTVPNDIQINPVVESVTTDEGAILEVTPEAETETEGEPTDETN